MGFHLGFQVVTAFKDWVYSCPRKPKHDQTFMCRPGSRWDRGGRGPGGQKGSAVSPRRLRGPPGADSAAVPGGSAGWRPRASEEVPSPARRHPAGLGPAPRAEGPRGQGTAGLGSPIKRQKRSRQMSSARLLPPFLGLLLSEGLPPFLLSGTIALSYL